jgi:pectin methylesterase-like acyl-CoA thioesterase
MTRLLCHGTSETEGPKRRTREGGSEWELIKTLLEGDGNSNKTNTASNTRPRLTTQVGQVYTATEVLLDLGTNKQPSEPKLARLAACAAPVTPMACAGHTGDTVRPVDRASQAGGYNSRTTSIPESRSDFSRP